ncbi:MAG: hypothetical protein EAZ42_12065 [Verrucomicrobia bacterium]|nr:MAG: hypothetical protein EAZ42_12065 [Verrucomicrobiota bacterium]
MKHQMPTVLRVTALWIFFSVWASLTGWTLSFFNSLHLSGYLIALVFLVLPAAWFWSTTKPPAKITYGKKLTLLRLWRQPSKIAWLFIAALVLAGGIMHPPSNYDALTYRLPRMYYWLQNEAWYWIDGANFRLNIAGAGFEWQSAAMVMFTGTDRWLFMLNFITFLPLPGLFFLSCRGFGIRPRIARWWMWSVPMAYGITLQASSIGNDLPAIILFLGALAFAAEARRGSPLLCLGISALAAIAMSAIKVTVLPLGLPLFAFWAWTAWKLLPPLRLLGLGLALVPAFVLCSFLPMAWNCWKHAGSWDGNPDNRNGIAVTHPIAGVVGNGLNLVVGSIAPPLLPAAGSLSKKLDSYLEKTDWYTWVQSHYPTYDLNLDTEIPSEENSGIGLGISALLALWFWFFLRGIRAIRLPRGDFVIFSLCMLISLFAFVLKAGGDATARLMLPWTPGLVISCLGFCNTIPRLPRQAWALIPAFFVIPALLLNPNRPLFPVHWLASSNLLPPNLAKRIDDVYSTYAARHSLLEPFVFHIPRGATVGFAGEGDHSPAGLITPLNARIVLDLNRANLSKVQWIVGTQPGIEARIGVKFSNWSEQNLAVRHEVQIVSKVSRGSETWFLLQRLSATAKP